MTAILLLANITRCFFWLGESFEFALLVQSLLMILAQVCMYGCQRAYRVDPIHRSLHSSTSASFIALGSAQRTSEHHLAHSHSGSGPHMAHTSSFLLAQCMLLALFQPSRSYIFSLFHSILFLILGRFRLYVSILGFLALGGESTLPIPQVIR